MKYHFLRSFVRKIDILYVRLISDIANSSSGFLDGTETKKIIARFGLVDVPSRIRSSSDDLCKKTVNFIHVYDPLQPFFHVDTG